MADLVTSSELAAWSNGAVSESDPRVSPILAAATGAVRRYCGWHVGPVKDDELVVDGSGGPVLVLPTLRVEDVESVSEDGTDLDPGEFEWSANGELRKRSVWTDRWRSVRVKLSHGFDDPAPIKQIVLQMSAAALASPMGATREQAGQVSINHATTAPGVAGGLSLLERDRLVLDQYKLPGLS